MLRLFIIFFVLLNTPVVSASNLNFLKYHPITYFTDEDAKIFEEAIQTALNTKKDGEKLAWKNDKTGTSGLLNPLSSFTENGTECRTLRIINRAKKKIAESKFKFCKKDDIWVVMKLLKK